jgi:hypothetical protein
MRFQFGALILGVTLLLGSSCGYTLSNRRREDLARLGVRSIFVKPVQNNSYKPGVENALYNQLVSSLASQRSVRMVLSEDEADAILLGAVTAATSSVVASPLASQIFPSGRIATIRGPSDRLIASVYSLNLRSSFTLKKTGQSGQVGEVVWSGDFSRDQVYSGNNQLDVYGTTSALINESEFYRALELAAESMAQDIHESMTAQF